MMTPTHLTIIMDGNGRWASQQKMERLFGHNAGKESVRACCEYSVEKGIKYLSLFAFSEENWNRPIAEINGLMELMMRSIMEEKPTFEKNNIRFLVIGDRTKLSTDLIQEIEIASKETENNTGLTLIIFLSYSGKWDILQAVEKYTNDCIDARSKGGSLPALDANSFEGYLATKGIPAPDLMIRTSGEKRISNYMLWQLAYTELYFTDVMWPDFRKKDLENALAHFSTRERRFGKTGVQIREEV